MLDALMETFNMLHKNCMIIINEDSEGDCVLVELGGVVLDGLIIYICTTSTAT